MKRCPSCNRTYTDASLNFCLEDGTPLTQDAPPPPDPNATMRYASARNTAEPPPTEIYRPDTNPVTPHVAPPPPQPPPPQWTPMQQPVPERKSNALWWVLGALALVAVLGVGLVVALLVISNMGGNTNTNSNRIANTNVNANVSANTNASPTASVNPRDGSSNLPTNLSDDFSETKWSVGNFRFGDIWYADDEYHMKSKEQTFMVMYAPSNDYSTKDATIKVTARSVDGTAPSHGFGLMVHCAQSKTKQLEDYAFLIFPDEEPAFEVVMHKDGSQKTVVSRTKSSAIKSGSTANQLEVRVKGSDLEFYVNGQYLTTIPDSENYKGGRAGLYTSDSVEVAFDDLAISRQAP
ncbi:MAG TPA: hypothetical protein VLA93_18525 [Pyrinomonadaceae bacterium]|nr:hypothetical protein [Pyrinomonadaceae bacterium]